MINACVVFFFLLLLLVLFYKASNLMNKFICELLINVLSLIHPGSVPSLAAGLFFGSLAGLGAYQLSQNPNNVWISLSKSSRALVARSYVYPKTTGY